MTGIPLGAAAGGADMLQQVLEQKAREAFAIRDQQLREQQLAQQAAYQQAMLRAQEETRAAALAQTQQKQQAANAAAETAGNQAQLRAAIQGSQNVAGTNDPNGALATRNALRVALASSGAKATEIPQEPKAEPSKLYAVTVRGPKGQPVRQLVTQEQLASGVEEYRAPEKQDKPNAPQIFYDADGKVHAIQYGPNGFTEVPLPPGITGRTAPKAPPAPAKTPEQIEAESRARAAGTAKGKKDAGSGGLFDAIGSVFASHEPTPTTVRMKTKDGRVVNIPSEKVAEAKQRGAVEF